MYNLIKVSLHDLRFVFRKILLFEFFYKLLLSVLFIPAMAYLINRLMRVVDTPFLLNHEVYQLGLSMNGLLWGSVVIFSCVILLFVEFGVILLVTQKHIFGKNIYITDALLTTVRSLPKLISIGIFPFTLFLLFLSPFIQTPISEMLWGDFNIPIILANALESSWLYIILLCLLFFVMMYSILRCVFVLHFVLLEKMSVRLAIHHSFRLTKSRTVPIVFRLLLLNIAMFIIGFVLLSSLGNFLNLFDIAWIKYVVNHLFLPFFSFMTYIFSFLVIPMNIAFVTRLYYRLRRQLGVKVTDQVHIHSSPRLHRLEKRVMHYFQTRQKRYLLFVMCTIYAFGTLFLSFSFHDQLVYLKWNVQIAAHRGDFTEAPENSLSSIRHAIENLADVVEIDVQMTQDGIVVLHHDYSLERMANVSAAVHEMDFAAIAKLQIESEHIPTLEEVLATFGEETKFLIELKPYGDKHGLVREVVALLEAYDLLESTRIQSSDYEMLTWVRERNPEIKIGQILYLSAGNLARLDVDFYTIRQTILTTQFIQRAHRIGREVWVWTVNTERNMKEVLKYDIDGIITDDLKKLQDVIGLENRQEFRSK